jgi:Na+-transporting methylmalonyl-CoA/oxaloacetate decarboxylase gamma subunit
LEQPLVVVLVVSAIGMTLLFLALAFFYGLLSLMGSVVKDRPSPSETSTETRAAGEREAMLRAAAIAVALARAEAEEGAGAVAGLAGTATRGGLGVSAWWALHHQRQLVAGQQRRKIS